MSFKMRNLSATAKQILGTTQPVDSTISSKTAFDESDEVGKWRFVEVPFQRIQLTLNNNNNKIEQKMEKSFYCTKANTHKHSES